MVKVKDQSVPSTVTTSTTRYQSSATIRKRYDISCKTLRNWTHAGKLRCVRTGGSGRRLYDSHHLAELLGHKETKEGIVETSSSERRGVLYARVSSSSQKEDLVRQVEDLKAEYPKHEVIQDVGSGLNFKRKGLRALVDKVHTGDVSEVVVMHRDRLCRFGTDFMEYIFGKTGTKRVVLDRLRGAEGDTDGGCPNELADDLLAVTTFFVARHNGKRAAEKQRKRRDRSCGKKAKGVAAGAAQGEEGGATEKTSKGDDKEREAGDGNQEDSSEAESQAA